MFVIAGSIFIGLFLLSNERFYVFTNYIQYASGYFIASLIALDFGTLFAVIYLYSFKTDENKTRNSIKIKIVLAIATVSFLVLLGYLLAVKQEWTIRAWIVKLGSDEFKIFDAFAFSDYIAFFATLISFGIFVLPFLIDESGILDNYPDEPPDRAHESQSWGQRNSATSINVKSCHITATHSLVSKKLFAE